MMLLNDVAGTLLSWILKAEYAVGACYRMSRRAFRDVRDSVDLSSSVVSYRQ